MHSIQSIVTGELPTKETIEDILWLTQKYEGDNYYTKKVVKKAQAPCHSQTYLQSPKSMKSCSSINQSNHLTIRINLTICYQCFLSAIKTALLLHLGENTEKELLLLARLGNSRRTVFVDNSHKANSCFAKVAVWFSKESFFYIWNSVS